MTTTTGDNFKTGFLTSTNTWKILEGLWATNNRPRPPSGTVLSQLPALQHIPNDLDKLLTNIFTGTTPDRASASSQLIDWILQSLKEATAR